MISDIYIYIYWMHLTSLSLSLSLGLQTETIHQTFLRRFAPSWHSQDPGNPQRWTPCPSAWRTRGRTCGHWWCLSLGIIISWVKNRTTKQILRRHPKIAGSKFLISVWQSAWLFSFLSFQAGSVIIAPSNILETAASACLCHHRSSPKWPAPKLGSLAGGDPWATCIPPFKPSYAVVTSPQSRSSNWMGSLLW